MTTRVGKALQRTILYFTLITLCFFSFSPAKAIEYGGVGGKPSYPRADNPRTSSIFIHTVIPGQSVEEGVTIINNTDQTKTISVFGVDSVVSSGGAFACAQQLDKQNEAGTWIKLSKSLVTLDSLKSEIVPFKINVPKNASTGEHNACIVIQEVKSPSSDNSSNGVLLSFRTGMRIALTVPGEIKRELSSAGFTLTKKENENVVLHPKVKNTGNVSIDTEVSVKTKYFFGLELLSQSGQFPVLRDQVSDWNFEVEKPFWGGFFVSSFTASYDPNQSAGVGVKTEGKQVDIDGGTIWFFSPPAPLALLVEILSLVLLIAIVYFSFRKYLQTSSAKKDWVSYVVREGENVNSIARRYKISWKLLASVNDIKAPYLLETGKSIKIPPKISLSKNKKL